MSGRRRAGGVYWFIRRDRRFLTKIRPDFGDDPLAARLESTLDNPNPNETNMARYDDDDRDDDIDDRPPPHRRPRDDEDDDDDYDRPRSRHRPAEGGSNGIAVAALILGILSLLGGCALTGIPAVICGIIGMKKTTGRGMAIGGLITGGLGTVATVAAIGLLLPAVSKIRGAAARSKDTNSMKMIGLGMHGHHDANRQLPPATEDLSWRVHILPYIEQGNVHRQFDMDQPWDSPKNRPLADTRIATYVSASDPPGFTETRFRVFTGPGDDLRAG